MTESLTPEQRQAVENRGGKLLVSAAAGSGKTKVLVDRLLSYLIDPVNPADLDNFLIITYTKAAAAELRGKIAKALTNMVAQQPDNRHLQKQLQRLYLTKISTVHAFCTDILREYAYLLDISSDFRVADENECFELMSSVMQRVLDNAYENAAQDPDFCQLIDTQGFGRDDRQIPEIILKVYNSAKCHLNPEKWLESCVLANENSSLNDASETVWGQYLLKDLHQYLDLQIASLERCITACVGVMHLEKAVALLEVTVDQLRVLRSCKTWDSVYRNKDVDYGRLYLSPKCEDETLKEQVKAVRELCKKGLTKKLRRFAMESRDIFADISQVQGSTRAIVKLVREFDGLYCKAKRGRRVMDFSDLEHRALDLLVGKHRNTVTQAAREIGSRFREVMVDEYQDSNEVQDAIFRALTEDRQNCFMVGDVKQSIYQFRLADPGIFLEKYRTYSYTADAVPLQGRKIMLSRNFRSAGGVIDAVNDVFSICMSHRVGGLDYGNDERLYEGIPHKEIPEREIELYAVEGYDDQYGYEAEFVADKILELTDGTHYIRDGDSLRPITPEDVVILLRSPGSVGGVYQNALLERGLLCVSSSRANMLQSEEIEVLCSLLETVYNPLRDISLVAVLTSRIFGFTADEMAKIRSQNRYTSVYEALKSSKEPKAVEFLSVLELLRRSAQLDNISALLMEIFARTRIDSIYASAPDGLARRENLQNFCQLAASYEGSVGGGLSHFLEHLRVMKERGMEAPIEPNSAGAVTIMSIHKSKGLEFPVVFLCGLSREFNGESARAQVLCDHELGLGLACLDRENTVRYPTLAKRAISAKLLSEGVSEEMRVLYVAMTRAKDRLIMTYTQANVEEKLEKLQYTLAFAEPRLLCQDADCAGDWILQTALTKNDDFWKILRPDITSNREKVFQELPEANVPITFDELKDSLGFAYSYQRATETPSKQTATQVKGRQKDLEAAELTQGNERLSVLWRQPGTEQKAFSGRDYGTAMHSVMQYINFADCTDLQSVHAEIERLYNNGLLSSEEKEHINPGQIATFFQTDLGKQLQNHKHVIREFKFSILDDASRYCPGVEGEKVLLQGVVDCALISEDGIIVLDFKTDYLTPETQNSLVLKYCSQIQTYADALSRIYNKPVQRAYLYFFHTGEFVPIAI